jgi:alanine or glycine:cation symporter, AGCS family
MVGRLSLLLFALAALAMPLAAFQDEDSGASAQPAPSGSEAPKTEELGLFRSLEKSVDAVMGDVNDILVAVFFYDVISWDNDEAERFKVTRVPDGSFVVADEKSSNQFNLGWNAKAKTLELLDGSSAAGMKFEVNEVLGTMIVGIPSESEEFTFRRKPEGKISKVEITDHNDRKLPAIVLWLVVGAIVFTLWMRFINFRAIGHAIQVIRGRYDDPNEQGEVTHFQALSSALSATVGLGNIAGVAIAVSIGGPGATFWMIVAGLLGMTSKFTECTLGQMYRKVDANGNISGGPMRYLATGLSERGMGGLGVFLAYFFAVLCVLASFGGGNMFQVVQSMGAISETLSTALDVERSALQEYNYLYGLVMALMVGIVIIGGIKRIAQTAEKIVPLMCGIYVLAALFIIFKNFSEVPAAFGAIIDGAFNPEAFRGGFIGVLVQGFRRAAFSNEAGVGSAAIAHSAAKTEEPVREGIVALLEPFIDTVVVCTMTALVIVISGAYSDPDVAFKTARMDEEGAALTSLAFAKNISFFPLILGVAVLLFAFSTMISWSYYGERCFTFIFGEKASLPYKVIFCFFVFLGSIVSATNVLTFSDLMILCMALPNILGLYILAPRVKRALDEYMGKLSRKEFKTYK